MAYPLRHCEYATQTHHTPQDNAERAESTIPQGSRNLRRAPRLATTEERELMTVRHAQRHLVQVHKGAYRAVFRKFIWKSSHAGSVENNSVWLPPDGEAHQHRAPQYCAIQYAQTLRENHPRECSPRASFPASNGRSSKGFDVSARWVRIMSLSTEPVLSVMGAPVDKNNLKSPLE